MSNIDLSLNFGFASGFYSNSHQKTLSPSFTISSSLHTHIKNYPLSLRLNSFAQFSQNTFYNAQVSNSTISGKSDYRSVSYGIEPVYTFLEYFYYSLGPRWGLHSMKFKNAKIEGGQFAPYHKLTIETFGFGTSFGVILNRNKFEVAFTYLSGNKKSIIGGPYNKVTHILTEQNTQSFTEESFFINWTFEII